MTFNPFIIKTGKFGINSPAAVIALAAACLFLAGPPLKAQYFSLGTDPATVKWQKIRTPHFTVIFPEEFEAGARYIASGFEHTYIPEGRSLEAWPKRFPVILHNRSVYSNAFVPYAPKRIEFLTVGPQDNYAQDWIDQLIIHEFRHAVQYTSVDRGFTRAMSYLFGQQAVPLVVGLFTPLWFIEGDATVMETALSASGRGRLPSFEMKLRAQFLEKGIFHYDKAVHGSYRDFIPDRYELGYQLVGRTRTEFGRDTWAGVMETVGKYPFMVVPFSHSLSKQTGFGKVKLYRHLTAGMQEEWMKEDEDRELTGYLDLTAEPAEYTSYRQAVPAPGGVAIAIKKRIDDLYRIVEVSPDGDERVVLTPGAGFFADALSMGDSLLCWGESMPDPRWDLRTYAVVLTYDLRTGKRTQLTHRTRYFAPAISRQGDRIVTVEVTEENLNFLVILDALTGEEMQRTGTPENLFLVQPSWSEQGDRVVCVVLGDQGKSLMTWEPSTGATGILLPFTRHEMSHPVFFGNHIIYSAGYSSTDDLFAIHLPTRQILRITASRFGAVDAAPVPESESLIYSDYSADGYRLVTAFLESELWRPQPTKVSNTFPLADALSAQENFIYCKDSVPQEQYESKKYRKGLNMFNFHSWAPLSFSVDAMTVDPGIMLLSQNLLGTSNTALGYQYNLNEEAGKYYLSYTYTGLYPAFDAGMDYGLRRGVHGHGDSTENYKYHELNLYGGVSVPLSWSKNAWYLGLRPRIGYDFKALYMDPATSLEFRHDRLNAMEYRLVFYAQQKMAYRDLQPAWGQVMELNYLDTPFDSAGAANALFSAEVALYFPGILRHQGFRLYAGYQDSRSEYYRFGDRVNIARGYSSLSADQMFTASATYVFPIAYPDWRLGPVFYIKRFKGAVFYDQTFLMDATPYDTYSTLGLDLSADFHFLSILAPFELGLRSMYFPTGNTFGFQLLWGFNIDSLY